MSSHSQFSLLRQRRFGPFFATQFLGAFNDNVFKNALLLLVTFYVTDLAISSDLLVPLGGGIFILPFFIFSALAGQLADKYDKATLIRKVKLAEIVIMALGAAAFLTQSVWVLFALLFAMGSQSAFFGPAKFALLPQALRRDELVGGNALVEMGTFLAILLGTIAGERLLNADPQAGMFVAASVVLFAVAGYLTSRGIPSAPASNPDLKVSFNWFAETARLMRYARESEPVFLSILGISWFWFFGSLILAQVPNYSKLVLNGDASVSTVLMAAFSIGVGLGSLACERLSLGRIELGLVPLGALGMTVFALHLGFADGLPAAETLVGAKAFLGTWAGWRVLLDIALVSFSGGLFIVPLMAYVQEKTPEDRRARVIAALNVLNALFMVVAALLSTALLAAGLTIPGLFVVVALMNAAVCVFIFTKVPEFVLRFLVWALVTLVYHVRTRGMQHIPEEGPAVVAFNHVSYVDALVLMAVIRRPVRFMVHKSVWQWPVFRHAFKLYGAMPIASAKDDPQMMEAAFERAAEYLEAGDIVGLFPEGAITRDGELKPFRRGIERLVKTTPVPVVPIALRGLWGSFFSHSGPGAFAGKLAKLFERVEVIAGQPVPAAEVTAQRIEDEVRALRGDWR